MVCTGHYVISLVMTTPKCTLLLQRELEWFCQICSNEISLVGCWSQSGSVRSAVMKSLWQREKRSGAERTVSGHLAAIAAHKSIRVDQHGSRCARPAGLGPVAEIWADHNLHGLLRQWY
ncbi:hypothetical protein J6590_047030 [Homalodisca vitripennis]|nr:hypothetical protein J6590_047030 [Homalodisca vitripennis]